MVGVWLELFTICWSVCSNLQYLKEVVLDRMPVDRCGVHEAYDTVIGRFEVGLDDIAIQVYSTQALIGQIQRLRLPHSR